MKEVKVMDLPGMDMQTALTFQLVNEFMKKMLPESVLNYIKPHLQRADELLKNEEYFHKITDKVRVIPNTILPVYAHHKLNPI